MTAALCYAVVGVAVATAMNDKPGARTLDVLTRAACFAVVAAVWPVFVMLELEKR